MSDHSHKCRWFGKTMMKSSKLVYNFFFFFIFYSIRNPSYVGRERRMCKTQGSLAPKRSRGLGNASPC